jgi:hypothetical protein
VGSNVWDTVLTHAYIHMIGPGLSLVYTAADPGSACPRARFPKYPSFLSSFFL